MVFFPIVLFLAGKIQNPGKIFPTQDSRFLLLKLIQNMEMVKNMLKLDIPGWGNLALANIAFDFNGTLAVDGVLKDETRNQVRKIAKDLKVYILTADTHGTAQAQCVGLDVDVATFPTTNAGEHKANVVQKIGPEKTICVGNGTSDIQMLNLGALSISIIGPEGCASRLLAVSDIVVASVDDLFGLLLNPERIRATLRS